jgi:cephalosporin hydroxylase
MQVDPMLKKEILSREKFEEMRHESAAAMSQDKELLNRAKDVLIAADQYHWIHQTTWFGEPILNLPQDMFAIQGIIYKTRPRFIIELGVAWGGSLLFYSTLLTVLGGETVIGVDIFIPDDLRTRLSSHGGISERIHLIAGSSVEADTLSHIKTIVKSCPDVLVLLDSHHSHDHVLSELRLYAPFVGNGHYLVCGDTIVESMPRRDHRPRPWGPGNSPKTALETFMKETDRFVIDDDVDRSLLFTCNPGGYLRCIKGSKA